MTLAHQIFRVYKNLDEFHDWPLKYRHWHIEVAENDDHEIWVAAEGDRSWRDTNIDLGNLKRLKAES